MLQESTNRNMVLFKHFKFREGILLLSVALIDNGFDVNLLAFSEPSESSPLTGLSFKCISTD